MRPQQQGRRSRNRGGGRRNQNPLQRSYESNGPDVKIRGNAQVIADKYATLARDALSSGDSVMAENYLQHAEHYNRIILAAQPPQREDRDDEDEQPEGQQPANGEDRQAQTVQTQAAQAQAVKEQGQEDGQQQGRRQRRRRDRNDERDGVPAEAGGNGDAEAAPPAAADASELPQPVIEGTPAEVRQEQAQQEGVAETAEKEKPKRTRRPRKSGDDAGPDGSAEGSDPSETAVAAE